MVEEIHTLETRQAQKASQREERKANSAGDQVILSNSIASDNPPSTSTQKVQDIPSKRTRNELPDLPGGNDDEEPLNSSYNSLASHHQMGLVGVGMAGGSSSVSLTLGLHENNGIGFSESFPLNAAQRLGLGPEANSDGYVMIGFEAENRHLGRDVIGGQLLHDFVG
uniref:Bel1 homeotic protein n=1 Tax=Rhizophora mucronata TaxID=61149 RepID=A0A2P2Q7X7_RHIMU